VVLHAFQLRLGCPQPREAHQDGGASQGAPDTWHTDRGNANGMPGPSKWGPEEGGWVVVPAGRDSAPGTRR